jgi:hypothetical protein
MASNIKNETLGQVPYIYSKCLQTRKSKETAMHHVITLIQEAVVNRKIHLIFLDIEGASDNNSCDITKAARRHGLGDTLVMGWLHAGWQPHSQEKHWRGLQQSAVCRGALYYHSCEARLLINSLTDSMGMAVIHWGMRHPNQQKIPN